MRKRKILSLVVCFLLSGACYSQFTDDFSDGDFMANPPWSGENQKFVIQSGRLKLQAPPASDEAYLSTPSQSIHNGVWEFYLQMEFNPSSTNLARIYLVANKADLEGELEGYFVKAGNASDEISFYRQDGNTEAEIIDGLDGRLNLATLSMKIKVTRSESGIWHLFSDVGSTGNYALEGAGTDNTYSQSSYSGVRCTYTSTRSDKFWFDEFVVSGMPVPDVTAPTLVDADVLDATQTRLTFSEELAKGSAEQLSNYEIANLEIASAQLEPDLRTVMLTLAGSMTNGVTYTLTISAVTDLQGNHMDAVSTSVLFFEAVPGKYKDIIITELLPDPLPQVQLPVAEYVEIYNRSPHPFNLAGWELSDGNSTAIFPDGIILPGEYWVTTAASSSPLFNKVKAIGLSNFPTLNNNLDDVILKSPDRLTIDSIHYALNWYRDEDKQEGGWSLEIIDPNNPCGEDDNWTASEDPLGGTPGNQNSVYANKPDLTGPLVASAFPESPQRIVLSFNEKLDPQSVTREDFSIFPLHEIASAGCAGRDLRTVEVIMLQPLQTRQPYAISIRDIEDCAGNAIQETIIVTGLPEDAVKGDVVVNEILFNPRPGGVDFVEIYNVSSKFLNLKNWMLGNLTDEASGDPVSATDRLFRPGDHAVFTPDVAALRSQYPQSPEEKLLKATLPGLPDDEGSVSLHDVTGNILDGFFYSNEWHSRLISEEDGISLERIDPNGPSEDRNNWMSASSLSGFATPGFPNSNLRNEQGESVGVDIVPEIFSPETGPDAFVQIRYRFDASDWTANVKVFDQQGRLLKTIANNETLGTEGFFRWDGDRDDQRPVHRGYYVVWFETFNTAGETRVFRKRVIVFSP